MADEEQQRQRTTDRVQRERFGSLSDAERERDPTADTPEQQAHRRSILNRAMRPKGKR